MRMSSKRALARYVQCIRIILGRIIGLFLKFLVILRIDHVVIGNLNVNMKIISLNIRGSGSRKKGMVVNEFVCYETRGIVMLQDKERDM